MTRRGFMLLEVLIAVVIIGIAFVAILKGFASSLQTMSNVRLNEQAIYLAETLLDDLEVEPPAEGIYEGSFADDEVRFGETFKDFSYRIEVEEVVPRYREKAEGKPRQDLEPFHQVLLKVIHRDRRGRDRALVTLHTILMEPTLFSDQSLQSNQVF